MTIHIFLEDGKSELEGKRKQHAKISWRENMTKNYQPPPPRRKAYPRQTVEKTK